MKFEITAEALAPALARIKRASGKDEILQHCMVRIDSGVAELIATDNTMQLSTTVDATGDCEILLPLAKLEKTAKAQRGPISFEVNDNKTTAKVGRSKYIIANLPPDDFPEKPEFTDRNEIEVDAYTLACMIDAVSYAQAIQDVRYYLNGVHLRAANGRLRVAATDGHRLAVSEQKIDSTDDFELIIPQAATSEFRRLLADISKKATLVHGNNQMMLQAGNGQIITSLVDGKYPDIEGIFNEPKTTVSADRQQLLDAASRALVFANETYKGGVIKVEGKTLSIESFNPHSESAAELIDCQNDSDGSTEISVNLLYLIDALKSTDDKEAKLGFSDNQIIFSPASALGVRGVIMKMRV